MCTRVRVCLEPCNTAAAQVTGLIHEHSQEFDPADALLTMKSGKRWPRSEYVADDADFNLIASMLVGLDFFRQADLVEELRRNPPNVDEICMLFADSRNELADWEDFMSRLMLHDNEILVLWDRKRDHAANSGTWMHAMLEHALNGYQIEAGPMEAELRAAIRVLGNIGDVHVFRTEWCVHAPEEDLAGSIDLVLKIKTKNEFILLDWKRSEKLQSKYNAYGKNMKVPLDHVPDCQGEHYRLQLNIYRWVLEKYYDIKVVRMMVVCIHPSYLPQGFVDEVPDMQEAVEQLMDVRRQLLLSKALEEKAEVEVSEPEPTLPFPVHLSPPATADPLEDDFASALGALLEQAEDDVPQHAKKRRLLPGADVHFEKFSKMFQDSDQCISSVLNVYPADVKNSSSEILKKTKESLTQLLQAFPNTSEELRRIITVAAYVSERNLSDKMMLADAAAVFWMVEGERHVRVHKGFLYMYNDDGSFVPFGGIPPESVLHRLVLFFNALEGVYRRMKDNVRRQNDAIAAAVVADMQNFVDEAAFLEACRYACKQKNKSAPVERLDAAEDEEHVFPDEQQVGESWTNEMADKVWKICCVLRHELMQTRLISLVVEWCETEDMRNSAVCYDDICFRYDPPNSAHPIEAVKKGPGNNCYVHIPHPLLDPVLQSNVDRLQRFYEQTFWCNFQVFQCFQSAIALAKRGLNIDRCFIGISPGGVGQSLYSLHLSEMYKQHHAFFDPNIWHMEEELRKQVESFARCFIITGQEAPESSKKLHTDLYKKTMSADGIMGRKPYGYTTRMFHVVGWKRLELNRMMAFMGVNLGNFHSIFRRGFIWKGKARFIHSKFLSNYSDHEKDGIFAADPSLNKFLATSQASIAGLRMQWAFERMHSRDVCYQLIEDYCNGGDHYLTEDVLRMACGIPIRQRQVQDPDGIAAMLEAERESQKDRDEKETEWDNLRTYLFETMLAANMEVMSYHEFKKLTFKNTSAPNLPKDSLWDEMEAKAVVRTAVVRHKTSKIKPGAFIPCMTFSANFKDMFPFTEGANVRKVFEEQHDIQSLRRYAFAHGFRKANADCMQKYHEVAGNIGVRSKQGRKAADQSEAQQKHASAIARIKAHESNVEAVLGGSGRRLQRKDSLAKECPASESSQQQRVALTSSRQVSYDYPANPTYTVTPRRYSTAGSAQCMSRRLQLHVLASHSADLDIENCCLCLTYQILQKIKPAPALPNHLWNLLEELAHRRSDFIQKLNTNHTDGKHLVNTVLNGGSIPDKFKENENMRQLQKLSLYLRWVACNIFYDDYISLKDQKNKPFPSATTYSLMWHAVEDQILQCWSEHVLSANPRPAHISLHFDGMRISRASISNVQQYCLSCEQAIQERTSFKVKIVEKKAKDFISGIQAHAERVETPKALPEKITRSGNCIPCALWHMAPLLRTTITTSLHNDELAENKEASSAGCRSYRSAIALYKADLNCVLGMPPNDVGSFMLHYEGDGCPHCVAIQFSSSKDSVTVLDGRIGLKVSAAIFQEAVASAVDRSTIVSYWLRQPREKLSPEAACLLDMKAGASSDDSEDEGNNLPCLSPSKLEFDESGCPFISDNILRRLEAEVKAALDNLRVSSGKENGRRLCPFCPFRSFTQLRYLRTHICKHHCAERQFVTSGTKQIKIVLALYDHAAASQQEVESLLRESATILRQTVTPPIAATSNYIDKQIRLVFDRSSPMYVNVSAIGESMYVRRVRNVYYTHAFADLLLQEMIMSHAQDTRLIWCARFLRLVKSSDGAACCLLDSGEKYMASLLYGSARFRQQAVHVTAFRCDALAPHARGHHNVTILQIKDELVYVASRGERRVGVPEHGCHSESLPQAQRSRVISGSVRSQESSTFRR